MITITLNTQSVLSAPPGRLYVSNDLSRFCLATNRRRDACGIFLS